jgi:hypothetical protein
MRRARWWALRCVSLACLAIAIAWALLVVGSVLLGLAITKVDPDEPGYWGSTIAAGGWAALWALVGVALWRVGNRLRPRSLISDPAA